MIQEAQKIHISFDDTILVLQVNDTLYKIPLNKTSEKLLNASDVERQFYTISPSGYGIHWPLIDEDLSIEGLKKLSH